MENKIIDKHVNRIIREYRAKYRDTLFGYDVGKDDTLYEFKCVDVFPSSPVEINW